MTSNYLLQMVGISKRFHGVKALSNVDFNVKQGEVHALIGENGAGKSTLIKILSGIHQKDEGEIYFDGNEVNINTPKDAQELGIATVHQELNLIPALSVSENIFLGRMPRKNSGIIDWKLTIKKTEELFDEFGINLKPESIVRELGVAEQQQVEIVKALSKGAKLVIMDEPTSSLSEGEAKGLFKLIKNLQDKGITFIYITHKLEELFEIVDHVTVFRDGHFIKSKKVEDCAYEELIELMVGRELTERFPKIEVKIDEPFFRVENLSRNNEFDDISFVVKKGEILGIAGLVGAGRTELARCIFGITNPSSGTIYLNETPISIKNSADALDKGICLVPEDRKNQGLVLKLSVRKNTSLSILSSIKKFMGIINNKEEDQKVKEIVKKIKIKTPNLEQLVLNLSGGNQQKVVFAKEILANPKLLILDEPTRGVDVGAKAEIYRLIGDFVKNGGAVLMISSELPEILGMSDRILVLSKGKITKEFMRNEATQEEILKYAL